MASDANLSPFSGRLLIGLAGSVLVLFSSAVDAVTVGRGPINVSFTIGQVSPRAHLAVVVLVVVASAALVGSQFSRFRWLAAIAVIGFAMLLGAAVYVLSTADDPQGLVDTVLTGLANPRPALGFYLLVGGAALGIIGGFACVTGRR